MSFESYVSDNNKCITLHDKIKNKFREHDIVLSGYIRESPGVFRGSKYNIFIKNLTNYTLENRLSPIELKDICRAIENYLIKNKVKNIDFLNISEKEIQSLLVYFTICHENNLYILCEKF